MLHTNAGAAAAALTKCARLSRARAISVKEAPHRTPGKLDPAWCSSCLRWSCVDIYSIYNIYIYSIYSIYSRYSIYSSTVSTVSTASTLSTLSTLSTISRVSTQ